MIRFSCLSFRCNIFCYRGNGDVVGSLSDAEEQDHQSSANEASRNIIVFHINTTTKRDLELVKEGLIERIDDMIDSFTIKDEVITLLGDSTIADIRDLQTPDVAIDIGKSNIFRNCYKRLFRTF